MIRMALNADLDRILDLLGQINDIHSGGRPDLFKKGTTKYDKGQLKELIADPSCAVFVFDDGKIEGYAICRVCAAEDGRLLNPIKTLYLDDLCVDKRSRGKGVGSKLFDRAVEYAKETGCHNLTLHAWELNPAAKKFYEKRGMAVQYTCFEKIVE